LDRVAPAAAGHMDREELQILAVVLAGMEEEQRPQAVQE
jgi:hypothetical protein